MSGEEREGLPGNGDQHIPDAEAAMRAREDQMLCQPGHIRPGILRQRHAWMELREEEGKE